MEIKVVASEIGEDGAFELKSADSLLHKSMARAFHENILTPLLDHFGQEMVDNSIELTGPAVEEYKVITSAVEEILDLSYSAFSNRDLVAARKTEPLEQVIDVLKEKYRTNHFLRLCLGTNCYEQCGNCNK